MPIHCTSGQIARVTFPDNSIQDFPSPVDIATALEIGTNCQFLSVQYQYFVKRCSNSSCSQFGISQGTANIDLYGPVTSCYIKDTPQPNGSWGYLIIFFCRGNSFFGCVSPREINGVGGCCSDSNHRPSQVPGNFVKILSAKLKSNNQNIPLYRISVKDTLGNALYSGLFNSDNYSVECLSPCPPNSIDCGDCCLDCQTTFNGVSSIRNLISQLR